MNPTAVRCARSACRSKAAKRERIMPPPFRRPNSFLLDAGDRNPEVAARRRRVVSGYV
jgi:hypothetical protein